MNSEAISRATHIDIDPTALQIPRNAEMAAGDADAVMLASFITSGSP
jgi:hypothetical protein